MKNLISNKLGPFSLIHYTGEMKHFGDALAEAAKKDPQLEQQVLAAVNELRVFQYSREKGEEMMDLILNPQKN